MTRLVGKKRIIVGKVGCDGNVCCAVASEWRQSGSVGQRKSLDRVISSAKAQGMSCRVGAWLNADPREVVVAKGKKGVRGG